MALFYLPLIFVGTYFVINLFLAVLKNKFGKAQHLFKQLTGVHGAKRRLKQRNALARARDLFHGAISGFIQAQKVKAASRRSSSATGSMSESSYAPSENGIPWYLQEPPPGASAWIMFRYYMAQVGAPGPSPLRLSAGSETPCLSRTLCCSLFTGQASSGSSSSLSCSTRRRSRLSTMGSPRP